MNRRTKLFLLLLPIGLALAAIWSMQAALYLVVLFSVAAVGVVLDRRLSRPGAHVPGVVEGVPLDPAQFDDLRRLMGPKLSQFVTAYTEAMPPRLGALEAAIAAGDQKNILQLAHLMKGSSANACAMTLSAMCALIEKLARMENADAAGLRAQFVLLEAEHRRVTQALKDAVRETAA